jgi:D-tyrosyl-tRNA(Tyr) deacylase
MARIVIQRVRSASVAVEGEIVGAIDRGLAILVGIRGGDTEGAVDRLADKTATSRIFEDAEGKMNLSATDVGGAMLAVSQFTLYGDVRRGKRPSFDEAARPEQAKQLYEYFVEKLRAAGLRVETGRFQEMMEVELVNDGPVTLMVETPMRS